MQTEKSFQITPGALDATTMQAALVAAGHSNTKARRAVVEALCELNGQGSPAELLERGRTYHPALGLVTVYRTLEILETLGLARKLHLEDGGHTYAPAAHSHGHHVICRHCLRAVEFAGCNIEGVVSAVEARTGYRINSHRLEMFGLCPDCQAQGDD